MDFIGLLSAIILNYINMNCDEDESEDFEES